MTKSAREERDELVERHGPWTAHNVRLAENLYAIGPSPNQDAAKLRRVLQVVSDVAPSPLESLRILDLACLEGQYGVEFAKRGARVVGIEGREANLEKARLARRLLGLEGLLDLELGDVRGLSVTRHGRFDVVLCLGILYHLDAPDVFEMVHRIAQVCERLAVFDTHVSLAAGEVRSFRGHRYHGTVWDEHDPSSPPEERLRKLWRSLDNPVSFRLTRPSLYNLLSHAGFTSICECHVPPETDKPADRVTLLAVRGRRVVPESVAYADVPASEEWPEEPVARLTLRHAISSSVGRIRQLAEAVSGTLRGSRRPR